MQDMLADFWQTLTPREPPDGELGAVLLEDVAVMTFGGADVRNFLQGYLTCDTVALPEGSPALAALCSLKGRVVTCGWASARTDAVDYLVHESLSDTLASFMRAYLAFSKTRLRESRDRVALAVLQGREDAPAVTLHSVGDEASLRALQERHGNASRAAFDRALVHAHIPWLTVATSDQFLPQALNLVTLGAVDFDKGCYLGQEVVARAQHRGRLKRHLRRLTVAGAAAPAAGAEVRDPAGAAVGTVLQGVDAASDAGAECLAVLKEEAAGELRAATAAGPEAVLSLHS